MTTTDTKYPVLPLRDIVVFPHMIVPLFVGREKSIKALEDVMNDDKQILLTTQKDAANDDPGKTFIKLVLLELFCNSSSCLMEQLRYWWKALSELKSLTSPITKRFSRHMRKRLKKLTAISRSKRHRAVVPVWAIH